MMPFYHHNVKGSTLPSSSSWCPFPALVYDIVLQRIHRLMNYDDTGEVLVGFQDYGVLETRKTKVQLLSILDRPLELMSHVQGMLADMEADFVPEVWERMAREVFEKANDLARQHDRTGIIIVKANLVIRTEEDVYLTGCSASDSTRQRLVEKAFRVGSDDPGYDGIDDSCSVCLEQLRGEMELIKTPCDHIFHKECIIRWLGNGKSCPLCRFEFD